MDLYKRAPRIQISDDEGRWIDALSCTYDLLNASSHERAGFCVKGNPRRAILHECPRALGGVSAQFNSTTAEVSHPVAFMSVRAPLALEQLQNGAALTWSVHGW